VKGIVHSDRGKIAAVLHADPGAVLGLPATSCNRPYSLSAFARQGSDIGFVAKSDFDVLVRDQPTIYMAVLRVLAAEVHVARQALASM
jgi:CRP-like cAMP-binding protein